MYQAKSFDINGDEAEGDIFIDVSHDGCILDCNDGSSESSFDDCCNLLSLDDDAYHNTENALLR